VIDSGYPEPLFLDDIDEEEKAYYFAYGSNMDETQMGKRCSDSQLEGKALLPGYRLVFNRESSGWGCGVADIVLDDQTEVWGLLYEVTDNDLKQLDYYEGAPKLYVRKKIKVLDASNNEINANTYEVVKKNGFIPPSEEYLGILKKAAEKYGFPQKYKDYLKTIQVKAHKENI